MTDTSWGDEVSAEPAKRRVPSWVWWGCGGGCLLLTLIVGAMAVLGWRLVREGTDPEVQWPRLAEVLPHDQRPEGIELQFGSRVGVDQFRLHDPGKGLFATVTRFPAEAGSEIDLLDPGSDLPFGLAKLVEPEKGTLVVQGREVACVRFTRIQHEPGSESGAGVRVDLSAPDQRPRTLELRRPVAASQRIDDAEVEAFLTPFDVWRVP